MRHDPDADFARMTAADEDTPAYIDASICKWGWVIGVTIASWAGVAYGLWRLVLWGAL